MNNDGCILADSIRIHRHIAALDISVMRLLARIPLEKLLLYLIDQVDAGALPILAAQFDVLGYKGMRITTNEQEQRELIKRSIELKKYSGTQWAIKEAMKAIGFVDAEIEEHADGHWAKFRVNLINENKGITENSISELITMINIYKNARSVLVDVRMELLVNDDVLIGDEIDLNEEWRNEDEISFSLSVLYDGQTLYNSTNDHSGDSDLVFIENLP